MAENFLMTHLTQSNFTPIAVSEQVFHSMQSCAKEAVCFTEVSAFTTLCTATVFNTGTESSSDESGRGIPSPIFGGHVFLESS
jgi:hypothetical protein